MDFLARIKYFLSFSGRNLSIYELGCRDPWTAKSVRIFKLCCWDPWTVELVRIFKLWCRDPWTAKSVRFYKLGCKEPRCSVAPGEGPGQEVKSVDMGLFSFYLCSFQNLPNLHFFISLLYWFPHFHLKSNSEALVGISQWLLYMSIYLLEINDDKNCHQFLFTDKKRVFYTLYIWWHTYINSFEINFLRINWW